MKKIITAIIFATLIMLPYSAFSQTPVGITTARDLDVNGMRIRTTHTRAQVEARWGRPVHYWSDNEFGILEEEYEYFAPHSPLNPNTPNQPRSVFRFRNNVFEHFALRGSGFAIFTARSGGIRVGDNISRLQTLGIGTPRLQAGRGYSTLGWQGSDNFLIFRHTAAGVITSIEFFVPM